MVFFLSRQLQNALLDTTRSPTIYQNFYFHFLSIPIFSTFTFLSIQWFIFSVRFSYLSSLALSLSSLFQYLDFLIVTTSSPGKYQNIHIIKKNLLKSFNHIWETKHGSSEGNFLLWNFSLSLIFLSSLWKQRQTWPERLAGITFAVWEVEIAANPLRSSSNFWFWRKLVSYNFLKNQSVFRTD